MIWVGIMIGLALFPIGAIAFAYAYDYCQAISAGRTTLQWWQSLG